MTRDKLKIVDPLLLPFMLFMAFGAFFLVVNGRVIGDLAGILLPLLLFALFAVVMLSIIWFQRKSPALES